MRGQVTFEHADKIGFALNGINGVESIQEAT